MLNQFNFENFKSYRDEVSLDMEATSIKELVDNTIEVNGINYLKVAAIYGANSSGKSNIIEAFMFMKRFIEYSFLNKFEAPTFKFDPKSNGQSSDFEVFFTVKDIEYQYGFTLKGASIKKEWLLGRTKKKFNEIYYREEKEITLSQKLKKYKPILENVKDSTLFLTILSTVEDENIFNVFSWFKKSSVLMLGNSYWEIVYKNQFDNEMHLSENDVELQKYIKAFDFGIIGIRVEKTESSYKIFTKHYNEFTQEIDELSLEEESMGTQKMFSLYYKIKNSLKDGGLLLIDELDAKLHPLLTKYIVQLFQDKDTNKYGAQLIFTTHDTTILNNNLFRRDQVWFSEKLSNGVSELYSLVEYKLDNTTKVRNDASYNKDYLLGRYGAIPILKNFNIGDEC